MIRAILFDYFGVISSDEYWGFVGEAKKEYAEFHKLADKVNLGSMTWDSFIAEVAEQSGKPVAEVTEMYSKHKLNWPLIALIKKLKGKYTIALATNAYASYIKPLLEKSNLSEIFQHVFISSEMGALKSEAAFYERVLDELKLTAPECVMIDDQEVNLEAPLELGMQGILYEYFDQLQQDLQKLGI